MGCGLHLNRLAASVMLAGSRRVDPSVSALHCSSRSYGKGVNDMSVDLNAIEISDLIDEAVLEDDNLSQVMAASCTTSGCACSSSSSSCSSS